MLIRVLNGRSQNVLGRQYANLVTLARLQLDIAAASTVEIGSRGYIASAHIYQFDLEDAEALVSGRRFRLVDRYRTLGPPHRERAAGGRSTRG